ncbi:hypothetical protein Tco_0627982, partial [Tanacetum coccineum]
LTVKKLEKKASKRTYKLKRLYKVGTTRRVQSSDDEDLVVQEDTSKQGRSIDDMDKDAKVTQENDNLMFDTCIFDSEEVVSTAEKEVTTTAPSITTAGNTTTTITLEEITLAQEIILAQELATLKSSKTMVDKVVTQETEQGTTAVPKPITTIATITTPKAKGISFREPVESTTRTTPTLVPLNIKDKGKAKLVKPEVPLKIKDQLRLNEELALKLQAKEHEAARLKREKVKSQEQANLALIKEWDNKQAMMEADYELCKRLQEQEQSELTIEEKSKLFMELMNERKRHFARLRAEERRRKPLTKAQKRNQMCAYLKNIGGFTHNQLKNKKIQKASEEGGKKRQRADPDEENSKRQKIGKSSEQSEEPRNYEASGSVQNQPDEEEKKLPEEELQKLLIVVPVEEVYIEALQVKYPIIDWEIYSEYTRRYWRIIRVGNHIEAYQTFADMLKKFDREDLDKLWDLVKERFSTTEPTDDKEKELWVELKRLFEPDANDLLEMQRWMHNPLTWKLYDTYAGHHVSSPKGYDIFMLIEKDYPLNRGILTLMLVCKLMVDQPSDMANELLRKIFYLANRPRQ